LYFFFPKKKKKEEEEEEEEEGVPARKDPFGERKKKRNILQREFIFHLVGMG
jgi:hypothetical protein